MSIEKPSRASILSPGSSQKNVRFKLDYNLKSLFHGFAFENENNKYEELLVHIRNSGQEIRDDDLTQLLREARSCISIIDDNFKLFVKVVLIFRWIHRSDEVIQEFQGFLLDLCSAHNFYTKIVIDYLIESFKFDQDEWVDNVPSDQSIKRFNHLHHVIRNVLTIVPMSRHVLLNCIQKNYPFVKRPSKEQQCFLLNILQILKYEPSLRFDIISIIINKLIMLDVQTPRSELEKSINNDMDVDDDMIFPMDQVNTSNPFLTVADSLDLSLLTVFNYLSSECHREDGSLFWEKTKSLYMDLVKVFEIVILPTHGTHHVQFLLFYFLSLKKPTLINKFLQTLWNKVSNSNEPPIIRQAAICYISSFLTRAKYISLTMVRNMLSDMANWTHLYIDNHDGSSGNQDPRNHSVFYTTCQSLFYIIAFKHRELVENKGLLHLQNLSLPKIVTCHLNPLRYCLPVVVTNFASIARSYQFAYCYTVIEHNSRSLSQVEYRDGTSPLSGVSEIALNSFFPFDPFLLKKSNKFIEPLYREYTGMIQEQTPKPQPMDDDVDDFLDTTVVEPQSSRLNMFLYNLSPGFLNV